MQPSKTLTNFSFIFGVNRCETMYNFHQLVSACHDSVFVDKYEEKNNIQARSVTISRKTLKFSDDFA